MVKFVNPRFFSPETVTLRYYAALVQLLPPAKNTLPKSGFYLRALADATVMEPRRSTKVAAALLVPVHWIRELWTTAWWCTRDPRIEGEPTITVGPFFTEAACDCYTRSMYSSLAALCALNPHALLCCDMQEETHNAQASTEAS